MRLFSRRTTLKGIALGAVAGWGDPFALSEETRESGRESSKELPAVDVLVCGGGPAGIAAALMSARQGAKTLLVERYGRIGGMAVQAMVGPLAGHVRSRQVDEILKHIGGRRVDYEFLDLKYADLLQAAGCKILLHAWITKPLRIRR